MAVRGAASRDGEGENSLPTPSADSDAHFSSSARGGGGSRPPLGGRVSERGGPGRRRCCQAEARAGGTRHETPPQRLR